MSVSTLYLLDEAQKKIVQLEAELKTAIETERARCLACVDAHMELSSGGRFVALKKLREYIEGGK
jgi:hypothetical protein